MRQTIRFELNQPVTVALESPEGIRVAGHYGPQVKFFLTEDRVMYAVPDLADAIRILGVKPGEPFTITKRWETGKKPWWDLERLKSPSRAVENAGTPQTPTDTPKIESNPVSASGTGILRSEPCSPQWQAGNPPAQSAKAQNQANQPVSHTNHEPNALNSPPHNADITPNGLGNPDRKPSQTTEIAQRMHLTRTPPFKPSYEEAFRECLRIVTTGLGDAREQWSDSAKQAMVSTLLIQLGRENRLGEFRPQAAKVA